MSKHSNSSRLTQTKQQPTPRNLFSDEEEKWEDYIPQAVPEEPEYPYAQKQTPMSFRAERAIFPGKAALNRKSVEEEKKGPNRSTQE